jgi:hypothetical protein
MDFVDGECRQEYGCTNCLVLHGSHILPEEIKAHMVRAWIDPQSQSGVDLVYVLTNFTALTSLNVTWSAGYTLNQLSVDAPGLKYLHINNYDTELVYNAPVVDPYEHSILILPHLLTLSISVYENQYQNPYACWRLPRLTDLSFALYFSSLEDHPEDHTEPLLREVGPHLHSLSYMRSLHGSMADTDYGNFASAAIPSNIWNYCPQLKSISLSQLAFIRCPPPPCHYPNPVEVVLLDFDWRYHVNPSDMDGGVELNDQITVWSTAFSHFRFEVSWAVFFVEAARRPWRLRELRNVVRRLHDSNRFVYDLHHTSSINAMERWNGLEHVGEEAHVNGSDTEYVDSE